MKKIFGWTKKADEQSHTTSHSAGASYFSGPSADNIHVFLQTIHDEQEELLYEMFETVNNLPQSIWGFAMCSIVSERLNTHAMGLEANNSLKQIARLLSEAMTTMRNELPREMQKRAREREERRPEEEARELEMSTIVGAIDELQQIVATVNELSNKIEAAKAQSENASSDEVTQITGYVNHMSSDFRLASVRLREGVTKPIRRAFVNLMRLDNR